MVGIGPIDVADVAQIRFIVCRKSRRFGEHREDLATHRFPKHLNATHDRNGGTARPAGKLASFKWASLSHIVSRAPHCPADLLPGVAAPRLAGGFGKATRFPRMG